MSTGRVRIALSSGRLPSPADSGAAAAERGELAAPRPPRLEAAVEHGARVHAPGVEHARRDRGAGAALADRHDRQPAAEAVLGGLARHPVREVAAAGNRAGVALVRLTNVEQLDLAGRETALQLVDGHRLDALVAAALAPAGEVEDPDRVQ